jgi:hypothetical protein
MGATNHNRPSTSDASASRLWVDARNGNGAVSNWELQLPAPATLYRDNVKQDFVKAGDRVTVVIWRAKNGTALAHALTLTAPRGRVFNFRCVPGKSVDYCWA